MSKQHTSAFARDIISALILADINIIHADTKLSANAEALNALKAIPTVEGEGVQTIISALLDADLSIIHADSRLSAISKAKQVISSTLEEAGQITFKVKKVNIQNGNQSDPSLTTAFTNFLRNGRAGA